jgi:DNA-directed RNA polymerase subunit RPC12/RpoP
MTATEELRRMLDERGVEYEDRDMFGKHVFHWGEPLHGAMFTDGGEWTELVVENASPEQAIAATLGVNDATRERQGDAGTCHSTTSDNAWCFACSECGKSFPRDQLHLAHNHGEINFCPNCGRRIVE